MRPPASLTNRIFLACTLLAMLSLGFAFSFVNAQRRRARPRPTCGGASRKPATLVDQHRATLTDTFTRWRASSPICRS